MSVCVFVCGSVSGSDRIAFFNAATDVGYVLNGTNGFSIHRVCGHPFLDRLTSSCVHFSNPILQLGLIVFSFD